MPRSTRSAPARRPTAGPTLHAAVHGWKWSEHIRASNPAVRRAAGPTRWRAGTAHAMRGSRWSSRIPCGDWTRWQHLQLKRRHGNEHSCIGHRRWIAEYIPAWSNGPSPEMQSHETCCVLNAGSEDAHVTLTLCFEDRDPVGPYRITVRRRGAPAICASTTCRIRTCACSVRASPPSSVRPAIIVQRGWIHGNRPTASPTTIAHPV